MVRIATILLFTLMDPDTAVVKRLTPADLAALMKEKRVVVVDVRGSVPYAYGHIEGALSIPLGLIEKRAGELPQDRMIVTYCSCAREETSLEAAELLGRLGFEHTAVLVGGYQTWKDNGHPTAATRKADESEQGTTRAPGRLAPPAAVPCDRDHLTVYAGKASRYVRRPEAIELTIETDWATTEDVKVQGMQHFLLNGKPFTSGDWSRIESAHGVLRPDLQVNAWVCEGGAVTIDWNTDAVGSRQ